MSINEISTAPYKGTRDFYPEEMKIRNWFFGKVRKMLELYGYECYDGPTLEAFEIYAAKSGEEIVNEQTYNFYDKGERRLAIRPEMTPTVARMVAGKLGELVMPLRWYSIPNVLRYENPQKGRLREHWQINVDMFGVSDIRADFEIINIAADLLRIFGANNKMFTVKINNRRFFNDILTKVIGISEDKVTAVSKAIDKRAKISKEEYHKWLKEIGFTNEMIEVLDSMFTLSLDDIFDKINIESQGTKELKELFEIIKATGMEDCCQFDFSIIRGFDYYTGTVFEVYDTSGENRRSIFGGGRYDNLVDVFKKNANVSGIGFGFGDVTLKDFLETHRLIPDNISENRNVLITTFPEVRYSKYVEISNLLRDNGIGNNIYLGENDKLKKQLSFAEKKGNPIVLIIGEDEVKNGEVVIKDMINREEYKVSRKDFISKIKSIL